METLIINIPDKKSKLVKQILKGLGVTIQEEKHFSHTSYKDKIQHVSVWTEDELKPFENAKNSFESLKPAQW